MSIVAVIHRDSAVRDGLAFAMKAHGCDVHTFVRASELIDAPLLARAHCLLISEQVLRREGFEVVRSYEGVNGAGMVLLLTRDLTARVLPKGLRDLPDLDQEGPVFVEDLVDEVLAACRCRRNANPA